MIYCQVFKLKSVSESYMTSNNVIYFQVDLVRSFNFRNSKQEYTGIPVMAANMDTVGTFEMAKRKRTNNDLQTPHRKRKIEQHRYHQKMGVNSGDPEG
jgi:hypothetical protein